MEKLIYLELPTINSLDVAEFDRISGGENRISVGDNGNVLRELIALGERLEHLIESSQLRNSVTPFGTIESSSLGVRPVKFLDGLTPDTVGLAR